ncbi:MAG: DUF4388 domain-containing protein [Desulfobulbaceae bacterium]|nr:DUF4388 domain-containing protein [Desulfobulbaceae bacterium]
MAFTVTSERNCPFYRAGDGFVLSGQAVRMESGRAACLILVRELTSLLFVLAGKGEEDKDDGRFSETYSCGGCTGLVKFRIASPNPGTVQDANDPDQERDGQSARKAERQSGAMVSGSLEGISPSELLQFFHMHQKTGKLLLQVPGGMGRVAFREGMIIGARFEEKEDKEAIFALLGEREGRFSFVPGIPAALATAAEIGDFMMLLMEGIKRLDEQKNGKRPAG